MNRISCFSILALLLLFPLFSFSQIVDPFSVRYQNQQKGGIVMLANVSVSCTNCATTTSQVPPSGTGQNNNVTMNYVDSDSDATTFMSSSDSLNLSNCSQVLWAGLYWSARVGKTGYTPSATTNYALRNQIKLKIGTGAYQSLTADELLDNTVGHQTYHCFKNITSLVQSNGIKSRYTLANLVTRTGSTEYYGGWTIIVVYKNVYQSMRNLTVFDGLANVSSGNSVTIPISGFLTPLTGPVNFELGVVSHDGDRSQTGDQLQFNGVGTTYLNVSDALHNSTDVFNSTIARNAVLTPFRNPSFNNTLGHDASVFFPNNTLFNYIGHNANSANVRITTGGETILTTVVTSVIDVYEPDLRATVYLQDLNGGTVNPGDVLEYTLVGKNIGSDVATGTYMTDTLDIRTTYLPNSISVFYGPNTGNKTDAYLDDQAEYDPVNRVVRVRIGTGANSTTGGSVASSATGTDSTVVKFRVTLVSDCMAFQCNSSLLHKAYIFGNGNISGNAYNNGGLSDLLDANGCPTIANNVLAVNVVGCPPAVITANPPVCVGDLLTLSTPLSFGGVYSWTGPNGFSSIGQNFVNIPNVTAANGGQYSVIINFPSLNCTIDTTKTITILQNPTVQLASSSNVSCFGGNNGAFLITNTGTAPYSYLWTNGNISTNPSSLVAGNYSVTVTDANTCFTTATYTITQPSALTAVTNATSDFNGFDINCFGASTGVASVVASGGTSAYNYLWSNGSTSNTAINLPAGIASVTITDAHLCTTTVPVTLTQPSDLVTSATKTEVSCFSGANGTIDLSVSGGVSAYSYAWTNSQITQDVSGLLAGTYSVNVSDLNGCQDLVSVTILQPSAPLTLAQTHQNVYCFNQLTGSVDLNPTGGTLPFSYLWSNGATTQDISGLAAGSYSVTVTDANLCVANLSVIITQPSQAMSATSVISNVACYGLPSGIIDITVAGGTAPYTYLWTNGAITADISNLGAAIYGVTITDFNSCSLQLTNLSVTQPASAVQTTVTSVNVSCFSGNNGSIDITPTGGVSPYNYSWNNGSITQDLYSLSAGTYNLVITDINGCTKLNSVLISQPSAPLSLTQTQTNVLCFNQLNGSIDLTSAGGTAPYTYLWSNGATTQDLTGLGAGNYSVTVNDANLCVANLTVTITQPAQSISATSVITNVVCFGLTTGAIDLTITGGALPYTYLWTNGAGSQDIANLGTASYGVTITDANLCSLILNNLAVILSSPPIQSSVISMNVSCFSGTNGSIDISVNGGVSPFTYLWSNGAATQDISNLSAGTYNLVTTGANGCINTNTVEITQPAATITLAQTHQNILCYAQPSGSVDLTPIAGTAPYTYLWSNGATTQDLAGLVAGNYNVTVTDANTCSASLGVTITQPLQQISVSTSITNVSCFQESTGIIDLSVIGGTAPYTYTWNTGDTNEDGLNLPANTYSVDVTDQNGCSITISNLIVSQPNTPITNTFTAQNISCFGINDGQIDIQISGGLAPYVYNWSNGAQTEDLNNIISGSYFVVVEDSYNCIQIFEYSINQPDALNTIYTVIEPSCFAYMDGEINTTTIGGIIPYSINWSNGASTSLIQSIGAGNYILEITDANGCLNETLVSLGQPEQIQVTLDADVFTGCEPFLVNFVNNSDELFLSNWYFGDASVGTGTQIPHTYTNAGSYDVTLVITDANGCSNFTEFVSLIDVLPSPVAGINVTSTYLNAAEPQVIILNTSEGASSYSWNLGDSIANYSYYEPGNYTYPVYNQAEYLITLLAVSNNGCYDSAEVLIEFDNRLIIYVPNSFTPNRDEFNNTFKPVVPIPLKSYQITIYNRWGELIYESFDMELGWDGTYNGQLVQDGSYSWKIAVVTSKGDTFIKNGNVNLFR